MLSSHGNSIIEFNSNFLNMRSRGIESVDPRVEEYQNRLWISKARHIFPRVNLSQDDT